MRYRRKITDSRLKYVPADDVIAAEQARAGLRGSAEVMPILREHLLIWGDGNDVPVDQRYGPMRHASEGLSKLLVAELRRAGVKNVPNADHALYRLVAQGHQSALVDKLKQRRGIDTEAERQTWRDQRERERVDKAMNDPIPGEEKVPFDLTASQRAYIGKMRAGIGRRDALRIIKFDPQRHAVLVRITYWRPAWQASVSNVSRRWVYPTAAAGREATARRDAAQAEREAARRDAAS
jgi:hypothetical protein